MATDRTQGRQAVTTTSYLIPRWNGTDSGTSKAGQQALTRYLSGYNIRETASSTALVKIRDSLALPGPITSAADGAAGNSTAGLHMYMITGVTQWGETTYGRNAGDRLEHTTAGSKIIQFTGVPVFPSNPGGDRAVTSGSNTVVVGRRLYATKAGAPATTVQPTNAQWFLVTADLSATLAAGMNALSLPQASITVNSTTNFASAGNILVTTADGVQAVAYTSVDATHFLGCTGGTGYMTTGGAVTQPAFLANNTATTGSHNVADASFSSTNPPKADTAGFPVKEIPLASGEGVDVGLSNPILAENDGGFAVEITSGTVTWKLTGA